MKKKTKWIVAGALGFSFAYAAAIASLYPENRDAVVDFGRDIGVFEPLPSSPSAPPLFINAGYEQSLKSSYMPSVAAQGCSADNDVVRLVYDMAFIKDERRADILNHPRIAGDEGQYLSLRRSEVTSLMQKRWQARTLDLNTDSLTGDESLKAWLQERVQEVYKKFGLKLSFRVSLENGIATEKARSDILDACSPAGFVPSPFSGSAPLEPKNQPF